MLNQPAPEFELAATGGKTFRLSSAQGKSLVLYFYPKDNTPGLHHRGAAFPRPAFAIQQAGLRVFGVSRDSMKSHENFKAKMSFPFELLSDAEEVACKLFDVIKMKNMYGKKVRGIERSTFVDRRAMAWSAANGAASKCRDMRRRCSNS